jgi:hypothetical protein
VKKAYPAKSRLAESVTGIFPMKFHALPQTGISRLTKQALPQTGNSSAM